MAKYFTSRTVCHHFGLNPFNTEFSLADWFMEFSGHSICMKFCGVFFIGTSVLASGFFLASEEAYTLRKHQFLQILTLGVFSLGFLGLFGAEISFGVVAFWFLGASIGGIIFAQSFFYLKNRFII